MAEDPTGAELNTSDLIASPPDLLKTQFNVRYRLLNRDKESGKEDSEEDSEKDQQDEEEEEERVLTLTPEFKDYKVTS